MLFHEGSADSNSVPARVFMSGHSNRMAAAGW